MIFDFMNGGLSYDPAGLMHQTKSNIFWILGACILSIGICLEGMNEFKRLPAYHPETATG
jgi:hypothetical protein